MGGIPIICSINVSIPKYICSTACLFIVILPQVVSVWRYDMMGFEIASMNDIYDHNDVFSRSSRCLKLLLNPSRVHFEWGSQWYVMVVITFSNDSLNSLAHGIFELFFDWIQWLMVGVFIVKLPSEEYYWTLSAHGASHVKQRPYVNPDLCRHMTSLGKWFVNFGRPVYFDYEWIHPAVKIYEKPIIAIKLWPKLIGQRYGCWRPNPIRRWGTHGYTRG